jgi:HSP20 family molecular chaperone IbpA
VWTEFGSRDLYRRLEAPKPIDTEKTTARIEKGMLRIVAPKAGAKAAVTAA